MSSISMGTLRVALSVWHCGVCRHCAICGSWLALLVTHLAGDGLMMGSRSAAGLEGVTIVRSITCVRLDRFAICMGSKSVCILTMSIHESTHLASLETVLSHLVCCP